MNRLLKTLIIMLVCVGVLGCTTTQTRKTPKDTVNYSEDYYVPSLTEYDKSSPAWFFQKITISVKQAPLISVLSMIRDEQDNELFHNLGNVNPDLLISISHQGTQAALLKRIQATTGYTVKSTGNALIWSDVDTRVFNLAEMARHIAVQQSVSLTPYTVPVLLATNIKIIESMLGDKGQYLFNNETTTVTVIDKQRKLAAIEDYLAQALAKVIENTESADLTDQLKTTKKNNALIFPEELPSRYDFFNLLNNDQLTKRVKVNHQTGTIKFHMLKGKLEDNLLALLTNTKGGEKTALIWHGGEQGVYSDHWTTGRSMFELMNNILKPYITPEQLLFGIYEGGTISVYYQHNRHRE